MMDKPKYRCEYCNSYWDADTMLSNGERWYCSRRCQDMHASHKAFTEKVTGGLHTHICRFCKLRYACSAKDCSSPAEFGFCGLSCANKAYEVKRRRVEARAEAASADPFSFSNRELAELCSQEMQDVLRLMETFKTSMRRQDVARLMEAARKCTPAATANELIKLFNSCVLALSNLDSSIFADGLPFLPLQEEPEVPF